MMWVAWGPVRPKKHRLNISRRVGGRLRHSREPWQNVANTGTANEPGNPREPFVANPADPSNTTGTEQNPEKTRESGAGGLARRSRDSRDFAGVARVFRVGGRLSLFTGYAGFARVSGFLARCFGFLGAARAGFLGGFLPQNIFKLIGRDLPRVTIVRSYDVAKMASSSRSNRYFASLLKNFLSPLTNTVACV